jgi:hypothetical protein
MNENAIEIKCREPSKKPGFLLNSRHFGLKRKNSKAKKPLFSLMAQ